MHRSTEEAFYFLNSSRVSKEKCSGDILGASTTTSNARTKIQPAVNDFCYNSLFLYKNMFEIICEQFGMASFNFLQVKRNGPLNPIKVDMISEEPDKVSPKWVKLNVCFPRYKANMKVHIVYSQLATSIDRLTAL